MSNIPAYVDSLENDITMAIEAADALMGDFAAEMVRLKLQEARQWLTQVPRLDP
jgi:hypothetical protein